MILSCQNICKTFVDQEVLKHVSFHVNEGDRLAIIGLNGAGKSTLLKIIMNELSPDEGDVITKKDATIGYLAQHQDHNSSNTIFEELLTVKQNIIEMDEKLRSLEKEISCLTGTELEEKMEQYTKITHQFELANGFAYKSEITGILKGLGFEESDFEKPISTLSGGQKTRVALGKLLLMNPEILLLDEPTNHLDVTSIQWLENYLDHYNGTVILVSHDRYFLDRIVNKVMEIELGHAMIFDGNYSNFVKKRDQVKAIKEKEYQKQQQEIKHQKQVIDKLKQFNREKSIKRAESREKMLSKMEVFEKPIELNGKMKLSIEPEVLSGNDVLKVEHLSKRFAQTPLFTDLNFEIFRGERVALIGANGTGKTTLLKIICKQLSKNDGFIQLGSKVSIGYYDQAQDNLDPSKTIFDEIADSFPTLNNTKIRNTLAAFLFKGDAVFKLISSLSGGEKGRVSLAKLMLSNANFLILDEPTNHLDIYSKEILESALNQYTGTVFYVSHDRYFVNKTATRILELSKQGLSSYLGDYQQYLREKEKEAELSHEDGNSSEASISETKLDWKKQKELEATKRKIQNRIKKIEEEIESFEEQQADLEEQLLLPENATNTEKLIELSTKKAQIDETIESLLEEWESLSES